MHINVVGKTLGCYSILLLLVGLLPACSGGMSNLQMTEQDALAPVTAMVEDYGDIELPAEMILVPGESVAMHTGSFQGGIHIYRGRVQLTSLRDYIVASMRNNKWKLAGEASYKNTILSFTKPHKTCMVILSEDTIGFLGKTQATLYVAVDAPVN